jgi:peptide/nickel transport system permease protein
MAERVAVMRSGQVVELAAVNELFGAARHEYARMLVDAARRSDDDFIRVSERGRK